MSQIPVYISYRGGHGVERNERICLGHITRKWQSWDRTAHPLEALLPIRLSCPSWGQTLESEGTSVLWQYCEHWIQTSFLGPVHSLTSWVPDSLSAKWEWWSLSAEIPELSRQSSEIKEKWMGFGNGSELNTCEQGWLLQEWCFPVLDGK